MAAKKSDSPQVGDMVLYTGSRSKTSPAVVTQTAATFDPELAPDGAQAPGEDEVSVNVMTLRGHMYAAHNVPREGSDAHAKLVAAAAGQAGGVAPELDDEDDSWSPAPRKIRVRSWKPRA